MSWPPPGGGTDDYAHRPGWIGLRPSKARHGRQRGGAGGQMQKISAGKFHFYLPLHSDHSITSSARPSSVIGKVRPSALAVLRLITSSALVDCCTGRSAGLSPLRTRPT